jgi:hypothetical protein
MMDNTREKLIEILLQKPNKCTFEQLADFLIANGVTLATDNNVGDKTHADRIRAMSDEELADVVANGVGCVRKAPHCMEEDCTPCILQWLKQPVGDE